MRRHVLAVSFLVAGIALGACDPGDTARPATAPEPKRVSSSPTCVADGAVRVNGMRFPQRCPTSSPLTPGFSEDLHLGSVLAKLPCTELPDFAGSYWRVVRPYPKHLGMVGHDGIRGEMTLVTELEARFKAKAIHMQMDASDPPMRFPAKGKLHLTFERIEGPVPAAGCD